MYLKLVLLGILVIFESTNCLQSPCVLKNITISSGVSHHTVLKPGDCNPLINQSEFNVEPNVVLHKAGQYTEKYTLMLLRHLPDSRDVFAVNWFLSNISPLGDSLTSNLTRTTFIKYSRPVAYRGLPTKYWLYVYKQNATAGQGIQGPNLDVNEFFPQKWFDQNRRYIIGLVGGAEFRVDLGYRQNASQPSPSLSQPGSNSQFWKNGANSTYGRPINGANSSYGRPNSGVYLYPNGTYRYHNGTYRYPNNTYRYPNNTYRYPNNTYRYPNGTYYYPNYNSGHYKHHRKGSATALTGLSFIYILASLLINL